MSRGKRKKRAPIAADGADAKEIATLRAQLAPLLKRGISVHRLASACGAHPLDMRGFLDGQVSLTWAVRRRLEEQLPALAAERP